MKGRLVAVTGTGTSIGKTHCAEALLLALRGMLPRVAGIKPIETGLADGGLSDADRLRQASSFHVKHAGYQFAQPVSPHLAAREAGQAIDLGVVRTFVEHVRAESDVTLVELAGGLFSPLSESTLNVDLVRALRPDFTLLVAPDRLGVLHDVLATTCAAQSLGATFAALVVVAPATPDGSTGRNAAELLHFIHNIAILELRRASVAELARDPAVVALAKQAVAL
jgi:dethiobiotin synthetase